MNQSINPILSGIANWLLAMLAICLSFEFCHLCSWGLGASIVITPVFAYTLYYARHLTTAMGKLVATHLATYFTPSLRRVKRSSPRKLSNRKS